MDLESFKLEVEKRKIRDALVVEAADMLKDKIKDWDSHDIIRLKLWIYGRDLKEKIWDGPIA